MKSWVSRPISREELGIFRTIPPRRSGAVAANITAIAHEIKVMSGPWPSSETLGRIETLHIAARMLTTTYVQASQITLRSVKQNKMRKKPKRESA